MRKEEATIALMAAGAVVVMIAVAEAVAVAVAVKAGQNEAAPPTWAVLCKRLTVHLVSMSLDESNVT